MQPSLRTRLFARTSIEALRAAGERKTLRRALGPIDLIAIGLGAMIGGGIYATIGTGVATAGPAVIVSFLLAAAASFFAALAYAELGSMVPIAGSAYTYAYATLGQLVAWIIGWDLILEYGISAAPVAQQWSASLQVVLKKFGLALPASLQTAHYAFSGPWWMFWHIDPAHTTIDALGALFVIALSLLLAIGIRETSATNIVFVVIKIGALIVFIIAGAALFHAAHFHPFAPLGWGHMQFFNTNAGLGIIPGAALVFFTFIGFDTATTGAEETRNPQRNIPIGVLGSLLIGTVLYCAVAIVLIGAVAWQHVDVNTPLSQALAPLHLPVVDWLILAGVLAGTTSVALTSLFGQSRIFYVMARDRMLPPFVARVHPRFQTPARMTLLTGFGVAILTLVVPLDTLLKLVNIGTFSAFIIVCAGVIYLRYRRPDLPRAFRSPFVPVFPLLGIGICLVLAIGGLDWFTWTRFLVWLAAGLVIYFLYGFRKSRPELVEPVELPPGERFTSR